MSRYQGGTDSHDPLGIMRLGLGPTGPRTYPYVGTFPSIIISLTSIIGVGFIFTGGKFILAPSTRSEKFWLLKFLGSILVGGIAAHTFILLYELNHETQHSSRAMQVEAILGREPPA
jgi:hypothetical protein|tara:strand:- start:116 stop:466 length:351 start_codon:yes stop_codon:yes gene_type:complete